MRLPATRLPPAFSSVALAAALAPLTYHLVRLAQARFAPEPTPDVVLWSQRSAFLERLGLTAFLCAVAVSFVAPALARRPALAPRLFRAAVVVGAAAGALGGALRW